MKKLTAKHAAKKEELLNAIRQAEIDLNDAVNEHNEHLEMVEKKWNSLNDLIRQVQPLLSNPEDLPEVDLDLPVEMDPPVLDLSPLEDEDEDEDE